jgi:predicted nucleic acid-binding protein
MKAYADTGFLVSLHSVDANTAAAARKMKRQALPVAWTWLNELEFRNALRLKIFRNELNERKAALILLDVQSAFDEGTYCRADIPAEGLREAERLSASHTGRLGTRSLDILHVSYALTLGIRTFLTFDKRQAALAEAAGLDVPKL